MLLLRWCLLQLLHILLHILLLFLLLLLQLLWHILLPRWMLLPLLLLHMLLLLLLLLQLLWHMLLHPRRLLQLLQILLHMLLHPLLRVLRSSICSSTWPLTLSFAMPPRGASASRLMCIRALCSTRSIALLHALR